jgi:microcystin-dependent protein
MNKGNYTDRTQRKFPLSTEGLDFIQQQILSAAEYAQAAGGNYILSGCAVSGSNVSPGTVIINGELLPFVGGTLQDKVRIVQTKESITAGSETYADAYIRRHVEFGSYAGGADTFNWVDLTAFPTNKFLLENSATKTALEEVRTLVMPKGGIIMWSGAIADIPAGFVLCDGQTVAGYGTVPNLRGKFIVGYYAKRDNEGQADADLLGDYGSIGNVGGAKQVTLTKEQMPAHTHGYTSAPSYGSASGNSSPHPDLPLVNATTGSAGGDQPHENRPPYYVLAYIIKVV